MRQIVAIYMAGDVAGLQNLFLGECDHNVQALTDAMIAEAPIGAIHDLALSNPSIGRALWRETQTGASIQREWLVNIGRRNAKSRVAHLLCEIIVRLGTQGGTTELACEIPLTQEQIGDALALTSVHINRSLKALEADGLISRKKREVQILDWDRVRLCADFNERYLHLDR
jgi:CRP-like cAMP-binding protein